MTNRTERRSYDPALDLDTNDKGTSAPFVVWEGDHTAFVHVLWHAKHCDMNLRDHDDRIATMLLRSRAMATQKAYARRDGLRAAAEAVATMPEEPMSRDAVIALLNALAEEQITGKKG